MSIAFRIAGEVRRCGLSLCCSEEALLRLLVLSSTNLACISSEKGIKQKRGDASRFPEKRPIWTAVSRILSARVATSRMTIYLTPPVKAASRSCDRCDYYPGANGQATQLPVLSCTAWGFSCPGACAPGGELLPRLFTLTGVAPGGLFSVTLSVAASFRQRPPHILCGMLPWGVRTFL